MESYKIEVACPQGMKKAVVRFTAPPDLQDWERIRSEVINLLAQEYKNWEFNLEALPTCDSVCLGMWVTLNAVITHREGRLAVLAAKESTVLHLLSLTKLDGILNVTPV